MALRLLENRGRAIGMAGTIAVHVVVIAVLVWLAPGPSVVREPTSPGLVSVDVRERPPPPPPPPPDAQAEGAAAPPSRGTTAAPSPPRPPRPLPKPTPAQVAVDPGSASSAGLGAAAGSGSGAGGTGDGRGAGGTGNGRGAGVVSPPVHLAGVLTNADYRASGAPRGAAGTVRVSFRVRSDGTVDQCRVTGSSGYGEFDAATCRLIEARFRFRPATDSAGQAIDWSIRTDYSWAPR